MAEGELDGLGLGARGAQQGGGGEQGANEGVAMHVACLLGVVVGFGVQWINMPPFTSSVMPVQ
jgi:hypothetical protein